MIVQVCPPGAGGVRDYADGLAAAWAARQVESRLVEGARGTLGPALDALLRAAPLSVVLHFSGYGYAPRGLCGWLADDLARLKTTHCARLRVVVVFHELFASGPPWRSAFWLAPLQSQVARRLARLADALWTNTEQHAGWLRRSVGDAVPLRTRAVFSNVGEPAAPPAWRARAPRAVVFGSPQTRARAFGALHPHARALARLGVKEIVEAGGGSSQAGGGSSQAGGFTGLSVCHLGHQPATAMGTLLASSRFGLLDYPARCLGKSGVFAAYAAHGCATLNTFALDADTDGLRMGQHYVNLRAPWATEVDALEAIAQQLQHWYAGHSLALQARELLLAAKPAWPGHFASELAQAGS